MPPFSLVALALHVGGGSTACYYPFGGWRTEPTAGLTDRGFTGHRHNNLGSGAADIGLVYMAARWYSPTLGRFISADTIVPNPANPQSYNRYSYVLNRPLNFTDPAGRRECGTDCNDLLSPTGITFVKPFTSPFIDFTGLGWDREIKQVVHEGASRLVGRMANAVNPLLRLEAKMDGNGFIPLSPEEVFLGVFDGRITFHKTSDPCTVTTGCLAWLAGDRQINVHSMSYAEHAIHEIFHIFDLKVLGGIPTRSLRNTWTADPTFPRRPEGLTEYTDQSFGFAGGVIDTWQKSYSNHPAEELADMGIGWTYNQWERNAAGTGWSRQGQARANFMDNMALWLSVALNQ